ncbi:MAG: hypothetical protein R3E01_15230 [Pirellulaceae bacterium]
MTCQRGLKIAVFNNFVPVLLAAFCMGSATTNAIAGYVDFSSQTAGAPEWNVPCPECGGTINVQFETTMPAVEGRSQWNKNTIEHTNPAFAALYGAAGSYISFARPEPVGAGGTTFANLVFPNPLPLGSTLIVLDIDARQEHMQLLSDKAPLGPPTTIESKDGQNSVLALWDDAADEQRLIATASGDNKEEAYVWDVSGITRLHVEYETDAGAGHVGLIVTPEPTTLTLGWIAFLAGLRLRRA